MKYSTRVALDRVKESHGTDFGKIIQKLLAISLCESGAIRITERAIQGIDIWVVLPGRGAASIEVKTTTDTKNEISIQKKDAEGLNARLDDGDQVFIACLGSQVVDDWIVARWIKNEFDLTQKLKMSIHQFRAYRDAELEAIIKLSFDSAVEKYVDIAIQDGQKGLNVVIESYDCYARP
jgi:hypothetical protein